MPASIIIVVVVGTIALAVGWLAQRKGSSDVPTAPAQHSVPSQLDRADFGRPEVPWLVAVFTSATCATCAKVWTSAQLLANEEVTVQNLEVKTEAAIHERYDITAVPTVVIADPSGVVRGSFLGPPTSSELWAKLAEIRGIDA